MAKSKKPKPSFDEPSDAKGPSDTGWVYRSDPPGAYWRPPPFPRNEKPDASTVIESVSPATASPVRSTRSGWHGLDFAAGPARSAKPAQPPCRMPGPIATRRREKIVERHVMCGGGRPHAFPSSTPCRHYGLQGVDGRSLAEHYGVRSAGIAARRSWRRSSAASRPPRGTQAWPGFW
jgi:hypothetical protein